MSGKTFPLKIEIKGIDRVTAPLRAVQRVVERVGTVAARVNGKVRAIGASGGIPVMRAAIGRADNATKAWGRSLGRITKVVGGLTAAGTGLAYIFGKQFVGTAAEFERYETVLTTIEGSSKRARASMAWISDFAAKTPYAMAEVTDQFVRLRSYGLQPMDGTLRTLGDTAAAMNKPLSAAVEAIADAVTGENERLKEFGIKARAVGSKFVYEYTQDGKTMRVAAAKNSREAIQATLLAVWNSKYGGSMDKLSGTWTGMLSNLGDQWTRFTEKVMKAGVFAWLKDRLGGVLARIDAMAKSGALDRLAKVIGGKLVAALESAWRWLQRLPEQWRKFTEAIAPVTGTIGWLIEKFGLGKVAAGTLGAVLLATVVPAIAATVVAVKALGVALLTTPVGWVVGVLAALAAGATYVYTHWEPISRWIGDNMFAPFFGAIDKVVRVASAAWGVIKGIFHAGIGAVKDNFMSSLQLGAWLAEKLKTAMAVWQKYNPVALILDGFKGLMNWLGNFNLGQVIRDKVAAIASYLPDWLTKKLGIADIAKAAPAVGAAPALGAAAAGRRAGLAGRDGEARLKVDFANMPRGVRVEHERRGAAPPEFELNQGYAMTGAW